MLAHAFLAVAAATERARRPATAGLIPLTCNEIQHLFAAWSTSPVDASATGCTGPVATPPSSPRPHLPLPATSRPATMKSRTTAGVLGE